MVCGQMNFRTFIHLLIPHITKESQLLHSKSWEYNGEETGTVLALREFIVSSIGSQTLLPLLMPKSQPKPCNQGAGVGSTHHTFKDP